MPQRTPIVATVMPWLYLGVGAFTLWAFWPGYLAQPGAAASPWHHVHAVSGAAWLALLVVQPMLARRGRRDAHRRLGRIGIAVMATLLLAFVALSHHILQGKAGSGFAFEAYLSYLRLVEGLLVAGAFAMALATRAHPALHGRWMLCTGLPLVDPVVHRIAFRLLQDFDFNYQLLSWSLIAVLLGWLMWRERAAREGRAVFPLFLLAFTVAFVPPVFHMWTWGPAWDAWKAAVAWFAAW